MNGFIQETDSKIIYPYKNDFESFPEYPESSFGKPLNVTSDGLINQDYQYYLSTEKPHLTRTAWNKIDKKRAMSMIESSKEILSIIQNFVITFENFGFDLGYLPPLRAFNLDDGSILIEWIFKEFRIGFNIEENDEENGWYLVANRKLGEIYASGNISNINIKQTILWLINFSVINSQ